MTMIIHKYDSPDIDVDKSSFVYDNDYILIQDEYICGVLMCMNVPEIDGGNFHDICYLGCFKNHPEVIESYALKSPNNAYYYALNVIKSRFELGEPIIATDVIYSYWYARDILEGRFELGEKALATDVYYSYYYAIYVLKGRFELGEKVIATKASYSYEYAKYVLKCRFELGEPTILNSNYVELYREEFLCQ